MVLLLNAAWLLLVLSAGWCPSGRSTFLDAYILLHIKEGFLDPHGRLTSWNDTAKYSLCTSWEGVTCNELDRVTAISLPNANLGGSLAGIFDALDQLQELDLANNQLKGKLPELRSNPQLQVIDLHGNGFTEEFPFLNPSEWSSPLGRSLQVLNMNDNMLSGSFIAGAPEIFKACPLIELDISKNFFNGSLPLGFEGFPRLLNMDLSQNSFSGSVPEGWRRFPELKFLNLSQNTGLCGGLEHIMSIPDLHLSHSGLAKECTTVEAIQIFPSTPVYPPEGPQRPSSFPAPRPSGQMSSGTQPEVHDPPSPGPIPMGQVPLVRPPIVVIPTVRPRGNSSAPKENIPSKGTEQSDSVIEPDNVKSMVPEETIKAPSTEGENATLMIPPQPQPSDSAASVKPEMSTTPGIDIPSFESPQSTRSKHTATSHRNEAHAHGSMKEARAQLLSIQFVSIILAVLAVCSILVMRAVYRILQRKEGLLMKTRVFHIQNNPLEYVL